jgi:NAD(P)-dependent dehydrogenase (short-subunit alcohol dehydrogenase family)
MTDLPDQESTPNEAAPVALVTGASRGIGFEFVKQLSQRGFDVIAVSRRIEASPFRSMPSRITCLPLDIEDPSAIDSLATLLEGRVVDLLINNAAIRGDTGGLPGISRPDFLQVMSVNVLGPLLLTRTLLQNLRASKTPKVVNISSRAGSLTEGADPDGDYAYRCSKAALNMATVKLAQDTGLCVFALHPGWVRTDMSGPDAEISAETSVAGMVPLILNSGPADTGTFRSHDGKVVRW